MPSLFPSFEPPALVEEPTENQITYPDGPLYDFATGDYVIDGAGRIVMADGHTVWAQWCQKAVMTERNAYLAYTPDYGAEVRQAMRQPTKDAIRSEIERVINEALLVDSRTQSVKDFVFSFVADELRVSFTVVPVIGLDQRLEVVI